jgi:hypothetical protein
MAETIQEFLVSVKYAVDDASQSRFLATLKRIAGSVAGVAIEISALAGSVTYLTKTLAETGEKFYLMSNRIGSSVNDIKTATFAMEQFGLSASEAAGGLEAFGSWTRSMGPSAMMYLRSIGVTARDTAGQLRQLGPIIRAMGGTKEFAEGTDAQRMQYAITTQRMAMMGINEQMMRAVGSGQYAQDENRAGVILQAIWGSKTKQGAEAAQRKWAEDAHNFMRIFREMGMIFDGIRARFGASLFEKIGPQLERFNKFLLDNMPKITKAVEVAATVLADFLNLVHVASKTFLELPIAIQAMIGAFTAFPMMKALVSSPLFWLITALTTLLMLLEDFQGYNEGKRSLINWGAFTAFTDKISAAFGPIGEWLKPIWEVTKEFDVWLSKLTGIEHSFFIISGLVGGIVLKMTAGAVGRFLAGLLYKAAPAATAAATGAGEGAAGGLLPWLWRKLGWGGVVRGGAAGAVWSIPALLDLLQTPEGRAKRDAVERRERPAAMGATTDEIHDKWGRPLDSLTGLPKDGSDPLKPPPGYVPPNDQHSSLTDSEAQRIGKAMAEGVHKFAQSMGGSNMFAGPGAPGDPNFGVTIDGSGRIHPTGGGGAGNFLAGNFGGGGGGGGPADPDAGGNYDTAGMDLSQEQFDAFRKRLGQRESGGKYNITGGSSGRFSGKYQFGAAEIAETARQLGEPVPTRQQFLNDPAMQERYLVQYTLMHHRQLMRNPAYRGLDAAGRGGALMAAHLLGVGGANNVLAGDRRGADAFGTTGANYFNEGRAAVAGAPLGSTPMPGQATGQGTTGFGQAIQHNNTTVNVAPGPDAAATAQKVAEEQTRLYERQVRQYQGMLA